MEYRQLRSFVAVARFGSFSRAGEELHTSQSALSYQIRTLEDRLQVTLFSRHARGAKLSAAGEALLPLAEKLVHTTTSAREMFKRRGEALQGTPSLGITPTPARLFVPDLLVASAAETSLRIEVRHGFSGGHYADVVAGKLDLALCYAAPELPVLDSFELYEDDVFLVGPPDMVVSAQGDVPFERLGDFPLVMTDTAHLARQRVERLAEERHVELNIAHEVDMMDVQRQLVIGHRRCTLASWGLFLDELRYGRLGGRRVAEPVLSRAMQLFARPGLPPQIFDYVATTLGACVRRKFAEQRSDYWWLRLPEEHRPASRGDQGAVSVSTVSESFPARSSAPSAGSR